MELWNFVEKNNVDHTQNIITSEQLKAVEEAIGVSFCEELVRYIINYGYLAYGHVEFYGINSKQMFDSDMVKQSLYLHKYFPKTQGYVALEDLGDGCYILVGPDDKVYEYISEDDTVKSVGLSLFEYILERFKSIN